MNVKGQVHAFTTRGTGRLFVLQNEIMVSEAYDQASGLPAPTTRQYKAIWDTGATGTVIQNHIITQLSLKPSGRTIMRTVGPGGAPQQHEANTYLINVYLPNGVILMGVRVAEGSLADADMLIGMDIIGIGDFVVTNHQGKTCFSFRVPSCEEIDFIPGANAHNKLFQPRNRSREEERRRRQMEKRQGGGHQNT